jgi:small conductance mechanosensitive channel
MHGPRIAAVILLGLAVYLFIQHITPRLIRRTILLGMKEKPEAEAHKRIRTVSTVIRNTIGVLVALIVLFTVLAEVGVNIGPMLASLGVVGLAVGFGAQSLIKDLINGLFILIENQYGVGDVVKVAGIAGLVEDVNLRRTVLRDLDGIVHVIPNGEVNISSNFTKEYSRININITVAYKENLDRVISVINRVCSALAQDPAWKVKFIKPPEVLRVDNLGASGVDIKILGETVPLVQWEAMGELRLRIKREFDKEGIEIPFTTMKIFIDDQDVKKKNS